MIGLARPLLADADIPNKILADDFESVRPCLSCQEGCMGRLQTFATVSCAVNPACARESDYGVGKADKAKKILVVGGGVAGCEAARVAAIRGHQVILLEKESELGGNLLPGGTPDFKEDDHALVNWYKNELNKLNIEIRYNTIATKEVVKSIEADTVIIATGSVPKKLTVAGTDRVYSAEDVLLGKKDPGQSTIIIGGGLVGCETALWLKDKGKNVMIVEMQDDILSVGGPLCHANHDMLHDLIAFKKIEVRCNSKISQATQDGFVLQSKDKEEILKADSLIAAIGYNSQKSLVEELKYEVKDLKVIGDANKVQNIMYAIWNAYEVARNL